MAKAEQALREAVAEVIEARKRSGDPLVVWQNGKVARIYPESSLVREKPARPYGR
jgi:hypothetical protein